ncbi:inositol phosphorylceramide synthase [Actinomadura chibensis]|uniref:Inositol phosphorylceramide synthase n=2 Tax=Actinomadura chibensis TaxID=392828 RepID=A0A5D0N4V7_9ACTN|nr:inositol phosphorylceramide synthase [Actinomadura chibensis]
MKPMTRSGAEGAALRNERRISRVVLATVLQIGVMAVVLLVYEYGRHLADGRPAQAFSNARWVWDAERALRLPDEASLQNWALGWDGWVRAANQYYVRVHFPATTVFLVWVWFRHRPAWPRVRAAVVLSAAASLALHFAFPLAPPRMLPGHGLIDLMRAYGPSAYAAEPGSGLANQFAAMPSLHVGWALLVAWGVVRYGRSRWRYVLAAHPVITLLVVVLTANHYWLDGVVGSAIVVAALWATSAVPWLDDGEGGPSGAVGPPR